MSEEQDNNNATTEEQVLEPSNEETLNEPEKKEETIPEEKPDNLDVENVPDGEIPEEAEEYYDASRLKEGFGREEYAKTIYNKDYYKEEAERLRQMQEQSRLERANRHNKDDEEEEDENENQNNHRSLDDNDDSYNRKGNSSSNNEDSSSVNDSPSSNNQTDDEKREEPRNNNGNIDNSRTANQETSSADGTNSTRPNRPNQNRNNNNNSNNDNSAEEKDSFRQRTKDKLEDARYKKAMVQNKINNAKAIAYKAAHPIQAAKEEVKAKVKQKIIAFIMSHLPLCLAIAVGLLLLIIILLMFIGSSDGSDSSSTSTSTSYVDSTYDYTKTLIVMTNNYANESEKVELGSVIISDYVKGAVYAEMYDKLEDLDTDDKYNAFVTLSIIFKSMALQLGGYNSATKQITLKSGNGGLPYCDVSAGCNIYDNNGNYTYVSKSNTTSTFGLLKSSIDPMNTDDLDLLELAYSETDSLIMVPESVNTAITEYNYGNISYNQNIKNKIFELSNTKEYVDIIPSIYSGYKVYDIKSYAQTYTYSTMPAYYWPIGSATSSSNGIYDGTPSAVTIKSEYGMKNIDGRVYMNNGIEIATPSCNDIVIASETGTVTEVKNDCDNTTKTCGNGYGNYIKITHTDGTVTIYAYLDRSSIEVETGDQVKKGQKIAKVGISGNADSCSLYFEMQKSGYPVNPSEYITATNPRPTAEIYNEYVSGSNNKQTVCLSLKKSGFSNNAVAALMSNIDAESSFNPHALGDHGTSYGLCQWHNGRWDNLKKYCSSGYTESECQLSFLIYELQNGNKGVYNYLLSTNSAYDMTDYFCQNFERPQNKESSCPARAESRAHIYSAYVNNNCS